MTKLFDVLLPEAQEDLICDNVIELVTVLVSAVPDPERPDDRLAMNISVELGYDFRPGIPWIDAELERIREISGLAGVDLSLAVQAGLIVALNKERRKRDGLREGKIDGQPVAYLSDPRLVEIIRPALMDANTEVVVWCHCWTVAMDDDGMMLVDVDPPLYFKGLDVVSRARIQERIRKVNEVIGGVVGKLMGGEYA